MITGTMSVVIPPVAVNNMIKVTVDCDIENTDDIYWASMLVAEIPELGFRKLLDQVKEIGHGGGREATYDLTKMPNKNVHVNIHLFADDDATRNWSWAEFDNWYEGEGAVYFTHIASSYNTLEIGGAPDPITNAEFSGVLSDIRPASIPVNRPIDLEIDFYAYCDTAYQQLNGWHTRVTALDSTGQYSDDETQFHTGREGSREGQTLHLGIMPNKDLVVRVTLEAGASGLFPWIEPTEWVKLGTGKTITIKATGDDGGIPSPTPKPPVTPKPPGEGFPTEVLLLAGGVALGLAALAGKNK